jgi:MoaA/NifB/PqqE/SkfB family radical SAM enzyme
MLVELPQTINIQASARCQLRCLLCYRRKHSLPVEQGRLTMADFNRLLDRNPQIRKVDFGGWGEPFLNEDLPEILRCCHERGVFVAIGTAANCNDITDEALDALVQYKTLRLRCAIDGVTQKTYEKSRSGGQLQKVLGNIAKINELKLKYGSQKPQLVFHFIVQRHNEHEIERAAVMAKMLNMQFCLRLNGSNGRMPAAARAHVRGLLGYADQTEYLRKNKVHYDRQICLQMWRSPRIALDGGLWGCHRNVWGSYEGNVFKQDLLECLNGENITYARSMLMGLVPALRIIPCYQCECYRSMAKYKNWITLEEIQRELDRSYAMEGSDDMP